MIFYPTTQITGLIAIVPWHHDVTDMEPRGDRCWSISRTLNPVPDP
jgi:hypothetical protein